MSAKITRTRSRAALLSLGYSDCVGGCGEMVMNRRNSCRDCLAKVPHNCRHCGEKFYPTSNNRIICSKPACKSSKKIRDAKRLKTSDFAI